MLVLLAAVPTVWGWVAGGVAVAGAVAYHINSKDEAYEDGKRAGASAGEALAQRKYKEKVEELTRRLRGYHDLEDKLLGMYAVGLAVAAADGEICEAERLEIDEFVTGCMRGKLPQHLQVAIVELATHPFGLTQALRYAAERKVPKQDIDDIIDVVAHADGDMHTLEKRFVTRWKKAAAGYEQLLETV